MKVTEAMRRCVLFCNAHRVWQKPAFLGFRYTIEAPGLDRAPFQLRTINRCFAAGLLESHRSSGRVVLTGAGRELAL